MKISNVHVYGLSDSVRAAKFPKTIHPDDVSEELTEGIKRIANAPIGSGHDNWLNGVIVQFDLRASLKLWPQLERYNFMHFVSSQSTMHMVTKFDIDEQCNEYVTLQAIDNLKTQVDAYNAESTPENYLRVLYNIPTGFELTARMTTNYRQLKTIFAQRKNHTLIEWQDFCNWIRSLPYSFLITGEE